MSGKTGQTLVFRRARSPRERRRDDARASDALEDARNRSAPSRGARAVSIVASNASTRPSGPGDAAKASAGCGRRRRKSRGGCRIHVPSGLVEPGANTARGRVALPVLLEVRIGDLVVVGHHLGVSPLTPRDAKRDEGVRRGEVLPLNERNEEREMVSKFAGRMSRLRSVRLGNREQIRARVRWVPTPPPRRAARSSTGARSTTPTCGPSRSRR